jgi:pyruvate dehydrogenase E2 component (dihydrolipoamide acetyltransferase)
MADVVMPQMGESIAEGTIVRWIKKVGDQVARDEPLFEISTDKVDAEIPSPAAGVLAEIRVKEGETVPVNSVVAVIGQAGEPASKAAEATARSRGSEAAASREAVPSPPSSHAAAAPAAASAGKPAPQPSLQADGSGPGAPPSGEAPSGPSPSFGDGDAPAAHEPEDLVDRLRQRSSPLVRKIATDHQIDISQIRGTGIASRVTKRDILDFIARSTASAAGSPPSQDSAPSSSPATRPAPETPVRGGGVPDTVQPMSVMRKKIAEHMIMSRRTSAHVHSVFEVNFTRVAQIREAKKREYELAGAKLTYLSFIIKAVIDALRTVPVVNASIDGDKIVYHPDVNLGIAVALDWGLIVPVIKKANERNLLGLSRAVVELAARARTKQLKPDEVTGGTFTITNPGVFGALFGMPIISQPQVAILGVGHIEKRPVVVDDAIGIRPMAYLTLGYDHRLIDGAIADQFLSHVKHKLETWDLTQA